MTRSNELAVTFLAVFMVLLMIHVPEASGDEKKKQECPAPVCSPIQLGSGWFEEKNGECVADVDAALSDLRSNLEKQQKAFAGKSADDFVKQSKASRQSDRGPDWDLCIGPAMIAGTCGISCTECMCCVWCWGYSHCWTPSGGAAALSRVKSE